VSPAASAPEDEPLWFVVPPLTPAAQEYVTRIASFWADEIYHVSDVHHPEIHSGNLWMPPVVNTTQEPPEGSLDRHLEFSDATAQMRFFMAHMGFGRAAIGVDIVNPGSAKGRLHSHSAVDEYYVVLQGTGTLRMGPHETPVGPGALIGKPTGPDLPSRIVADRGEALTILDIEVWPEAGYHSKDVVHYPDFGEVMLRGSGWGAITPTESLLPRDDLGKHYEDGYWRKQDGTWEPKQIPGAPARSASEGSTD
jgi:uncharacterized cupin superfamily protein